MSKYSLNLKKALTLMPDGVYRANIVSYTEEVGKAGPYIRWRIVILHDLDGNTEDCADKVLFPMVSMSENAVSFVVDFLLALGYTMEEIDSEEFEFDPDEYVGKDVYVSVTTQRNPTTDRDQNVVGKFVQVQYEDDDEVEEAFGPKTLEEVEAETTTE